MSPGRWVGLCAGACLLAGALPVQAQHDDDQTDDHARRDRQYMRRYEEAQQPPQPAVDTAVDRAAAAEAFYREVDKLIRDRNYRAANSEHYRVQTDDPRLDPEAVAALFEEFRADFDAFWSPRLDLQPFDEQGRAFLFWSFNKYNRLLDGDFRFQANRPKGHYGTMFDAIAVHTDSDTPGNLGDTLIHEAAHQLVDRRFGWTVEPAAWLAEGLASYHGFQAQAKDGAFVHDEVGAKNARLFREGKMPRSRQAQLYVSAFRDALRGMDAETSLYGMLLASDDRATFYGDGSAVTYAASWLLIHWLLHGDDGVHAEPFARWLEAEIAGEGGMERLLGELGLTPDALDRAVLAHAKTIKIR